MEAIAKVILFVLIHPNAVIAASKGSVWGVAIVVVYGLLLLTSVVALAVVIERYVRLRRSRLTDETLRTLVPEKIAAGDFDGAISASEASPTLLGLALAPELKHLQQGSSTAEEAVEETGAVVAEKLSANLDILKTVATVAPLLGLLGTVLGMMYAFDQIETIHRKETLAQGIVSALDTTVRGLIIAIGCISVERHLLRRIDHASRDYSTQLTHIARSLRRRKPSETKSPPVDPAGEPEEDRA